MSDADLVSLHANAARLIAQGTDQQVAAAKDALPLIDVELARRAPPPQPPKPARKRTAKASAPGGDQPTPSTAL